MTLLTGYSLMAAFCTVYLIFCFWRDLILLSVLVASSKSLKFALQYRLGSCVIDILAVFVVSCSCFVKLVQEEDKDLASYMGAFISTYKLYDIFDESQFGICFALLFSNVIT